MKRNNRCDLVYHWVWIVRFWLIGKTLTSAAMLSRHFNLDLFPSGDFCYTSRINLSSGCLRTSPAHLSGWDLVCRTVLSVLHSVYFCAAASVGLFLYIFLSIHFSNLRMTSLFHTVSVHDSQSYDDLMTVLYTLDLGSSGNLFESKRILKDIQAIWKLSWRLRKKRNLLKKKGTYYDIRSFQIIMCPLVYRNFLFYFYHYG